ncbi:MAG: hypothetical protein EPO63_06630 [Candidatus Nitrosotenuis sp.]|nr:MAG: hypothetical protein EPO63_06630 [Candidatus Nitrosotenuis sp.]
MFPKGLVIAVCTGVVSAIIFGVYLEQLNSKKQGLEFIEGPSLSVMTDKQNYLAGQSIQIRIINSGTQVLMFSDKAPKLQIRALDGTTIFSSNIQNSTLDPKQESVFVWNQTKNDGTMVIGGRYVVESSTFTENEQKITDSVTINVLK